MRVFERPHVCEGHRCAYIQCPNAHRGAYLYRVHVGPFANRFVRECRYVYEWVPDWRYQDFAVLEYRWAEG